MQLRRIRRYKSVIRITPDPAFTWFNRTDQSVISLFNMFVHVLILGGITATFLWELMRHILVWYYSSLSLVNLIYGSLATTIIALLSIEVAAIILLLGAQVIAEFERNTRGLHNDNSSGFET